jgi:hypothetical protein
MVSAEQHDRRVAELLAANNAEVERRRAAEHEITAVARSIAAIFRSTLGRSGSFPGWRDDTEFLLIFLLRHGITLPAHHRIYEHPIPPDMEDAVRAAGGFLSVEEWRQAGSPI